MSYPARRWRDMVVSVMLIVRVERALQAGSLARAAELGHVKVAMDGAAAPLGLPTEAGLSRRELEQLDTAWRILRHGPFNGTCLRRAIVGGYFVRNRSPKVRIGVSKVHGTVAAHAWLEVNGVGLDPDGAVAYSVLDSPTRVAT